MANFDDFTEERARATGLLKWEAPDVSGHWVAEMDFGTDPQIEQALVESIKKGFLGYMPNALALRVKKASANVLTRRYNWEVSPTQVSLASSVLDGLQAILGHMLRPGSRVIVPTPAYMPFLTLPGKYGHEVVQIPSQLVDGVWQFDFDRIEEAAKTADLLILCNPWNPTGRVLTESELVRFGLIATASNLIVFNDEIHAPLVSEPAKHVPFASLDPDFANHTITAIAASKGFNLAGLHCAQMVTTDAMTERFKDVSAWLRYPTPLGALATCIAYEDGDLWLAELNEYLRKNVALIDELIEGSTLSWSKPEGTYMALIDASSLGVDNPSVAFLKKAHVNTTAGVALGEGFDQYVRFGFASSASVVRNSIQKTVTLASGRAL